jgi:hypothetical protein
MIFLDCPAWMDQDGAARCGLPAEVRCRFTMRSTDGPVQSAMIRCLAGHQFNGPVEFLTRNSTNKHHPGTDGVRSPAQRDSLQGNHDGRADSRGIAARELPGKPEGGIPRPNSAPAYYLGRPARLWITAMSPRRSPRLVADRRR